MVTAQQSEVVAVQKEVASVDTHLIQVPFKVNGNNDLMKRKDLRKRNFQQEIESQHIERWRIL